MSSPATKPQAASSEEAPIPESDRVPPVQKFAYSMGIVSDHFAIYGLNQLIMPVFNVLLHLSPTMASNALAIARLWDAVTDPLVGSMSDNSRNKMGRRRPFIIVGAIITAIAFPLIWLASEGWSPNQIFAYLVFSLLLLYTGYSIFSVPYESLGMELTPNYRERTNLFVIRSYIERIFSMGIAWLFAIANLDYFGDPLVGTRVVSIFAGVVILIGGVLPGIYCIERYRKVASHQTKEPIFTALWSMRRNLPCLNIITIISFFLFAMGTVGVLDFYMGTYYVYGGDLKAGSFLGGYSGTLNVVTGVAGAFLVQKLSKRFDKHHLLLACLGVLFLCKLGLYVTYFPNQPLLTFVTKPFATMASTGFWILVLSMRADVADWDEYIFGKRREGIIAAIGNWFVKVSITISVISGGRLLEHIVKFDAERGGDQLPGVLERMKLIYAFFPAASLLILSYFVFKYPLTKKRMECVRTILERRREAV